ncbi:SDR family oxidoreductase [Curtobacterium sp. MCLR17_054]|uniref:SDR family NAD(P)-dependent oxidoreductase n=1 Tax=Curtobacterium sp. MCLR17_054 TaxID=2175632 RepID=UPI000DA8E113|nr:SDR family oxidoreductase [Curtobacterium sp. MCLR17_054]WIE70233.1 SDR family oxidoreductase [Curtobacterium sp. MCLR17_054]
MINQNTNHQQVALVVGASRGIGAATASRLADTGYLVYGTHRGSGVPEGVRPLEADVTDDASVRTAVRTIAAEAGRLDVAVVNAGIVRQDLLVRMTPAALEEVFRVNTFGAILATKHIMSVINRQASGSVVLVSSESSKAGIPGSSHYTASKAALEGFARSIMWEYGPRGIRINVVAPGSTETDMFAQVDEGHRARLLERTPLGRFGQPHEIAQTIHWIAESTYLTGACIPVTGGEGLGY